jgi:hypothetical protein
MNEVALLIDDYSHIQVPTYIAHNQINEWYVTPYAALQIRCGLLNSLPVFLFCDLREQHHQWQQPFSNLCRVRRIFIAVLVVLILSTFNSLSLGIGKNATPFTHVLLNLTGSPYLDSSPNKLSAGMVNHFPRNQCLVWRTTALGRRWEFNRSRCTVCTRAGGSEGCTSREDLKSRTSEEVELHMDLGMVREFEINVERQYFFFESFI